MVAPADRGENLAPMAPAPAAAPPATSGPARAAGNANVAAGVIPYRLRVGVTGHRRLPDDPALAAQVARAVRRIRELTPSSPHTPLRLAAVSPLAEGADRLVAGQVLADEGAMLEAALPLPREDYVRDFETAGSRGEFDGFLARASGVVVLPPCETRGEAYERAGRYIVEHSDAMIALWDGAPARGRGGTAEIVDYARARDVPLFWVHTEAPYVLVEERGEKLAVGAFGALDTYNRARLAGRRLHRATALVRGQEGNLAEGSARAGLGSAFMQPYCAWMLPHFVRAEVLARRYQALYYLFGDLLFYCGAGAVAVAGLAAVVGEGLEGAARFILPGLEIVLMLLVLLVLFAGRRLRLHERWLAYRFLAERFRSGLILAPALPPGPRLVTADTARAEDAAERWLGRAYDEVWAERPHPTTPTPSAVPAAPPVADAGVPLDGLKALLLSAWIDDQIGYQRMAAGRYERRHRRSTGLTAAIFTLTLTAAVAHGVEVRGTVTNIPLGGVPILLSIALPAFAGAVAAIGAQREYPRNAHRAHQIARDLEEMRRRLARASTLEGVRGVAQEAEAVMLTENRDWFVVMRFHDFELHV